MRRGLSALLAAAAVTAGAGEGQRPGGQPPCGPQSQPDVSSTGGDTTAQSGAAAGGNGGNAGANGGNANAQNSSQTQQRNDDGSPIGLI